MKRKAENDLKPGNNKITKISNTPTTKPTALENRQFNTPHSLKTKPNETPHTYKGTSRQGSSIPASVSSRNIQPKKGSFAEILARAKNNQGPPVGIITHKPKEKISAKKEIALEKELARKKPVKGVVGKSGLVNKTTELAIRKSVPDNKAGGKVVKPGAYQGTGKSSTKPQPSANYHGTAKAKPQASYQGTMKSSKVAVSSKRAYHSDSEPVRSKLQSSSKHRRKEDDLDDDESEGYGSEDQYTYASEDYSDMDAGFEDVEEEDVMAERAARKEDAREQAELERLKREKERKKALVSQTKAKGRI